MTLFVLFNIIQPVGWRVGVVRVETSPSASRSASALRVYLAFGRASRLEWAPHLGTEKRLFSTRA